MSTLKSPVLPSALAKPVKSGKKKTKAEEEEERRAKEAADAAALAAAIPPSPFDRIEEVWALDGQFAAQRALVGQLFEIEDGPGICIQSLTLDDTYAHLHFARSIGLNNEQTKIFFGIMESLNNKLQDTTITMEDAFQSFKQAIMANSAVVRGKQPSSQPTPDLTNINLTTPISPSSAHTSARPNRPTSSKGSAKEATSHDSTRPSSRGKDQPAAAAGGSSRGSGGGKTPRSPAPEEPQFVIPPPLPPAQPKTFSIDTIKQITEYVTRTYFQHYRLYQAVFNSSHFRPRKNLLIERLLVETVIPDGYSLNDAVDLQAQEAKQKEAADNRPAQSTVDIWRASDEPTRPTTSDGQAAADGWAQDEISQLVHQHMLKARAQLQTLISENEKQLDAKLKSLEQKLAPPVTHLKSPHGTSSKKK